MLTNIQESFLHLVRLGTGTSIDTKISDEIDWDALKALADKQGLTAIVLDGLNEALKLNSQLSTLNTQLKLSWIGEVHQNYEQRYEKCRQTIGQLSRFYNDHGFRLMVLKGYGLSLNYPKPNHRPCGDIDIWAFGQYKEADAAISKEFSIPIEHDHHHHTVFKFKGFTVENHYDFLNVHHHKSNKELEAILKKLGQDDSHHVLLRGEKVYLPSANLHALFLLRHSMSNFAAAGMKLRQLLDWAFFVKAHSTEIDWNWLEGVLETCGMKCLYDVFNAICVSDLGFDVSIFPQVQFDPCLKDRVLNDILSPEFSEKEKGGFVSRAVYKYRRWRANAWKHELCFKESMWSAFWSGIWSHLLKPASI